MFVRAFLGSMLRSPWLLRPGWALALGRWLVLVCLLPAALWGHASPNKSAVLADIGVHGQPGFNALPVTLPLGKVTVLDQACILPDAGFSTPPPDAARWLHLQLPNKWLETHPGHHGAMWYRFKVVLPDLPKRPWAVYLPRVIMNGQVWINDVALGYSGSMSDPVTRNWYVPLMFSVPTNLWHPGENLVYVRVAGGYMSNDGLAPIEIGPVERVATAYQLRYWLQVDGPQIVSVALIVLGLMMIVMWLRDRAQTAFGYMGMSAVCWGTSTLMSLSTSIPTSPQAWEVMFSTLIVWHHVSMSAFFFRFAEVRQPWFYRALAAYGVFTLVFFSTSATVYALGYFDALDFVLALAGMAFTVWHVARHGRPDGWWMVAGCLIILPCGWHDVLVATGSLPFGSIYYLHLFGPAAVLLSYVVMAGDYARSSAALHHLNRSLAQRVAERESELRESFGRLAELERNQAVSAERSRILKDMHDGVGAHLTSALRQLQSPREAGVDIGLVTQTLRDSLDQLKLSVDALSLMPGDVQGLLASLRFRITPRLKAAGLTLLWDVPDLPSWPQGQAPALRQLQYILFEGLSNVLQHSGASTLTLSARAFADHIQVSLIDNGQGWHQGAEEGQGLQTMRARAGVIGATVEFHGALQGGAELRVMLPLHNEAWSDLSSAA
jgi:signal transduction histidine kinase